MARALWLSVVILAIVQHPPTFWQGCLIGALAVGAALPWLNNAIPLVLAAVVVVLLIV